MSKLITLEMLKEKNVKNYTCESFEDFFGAEVILTSSFCEKYVGNFDFYMLAFEFFDDTDLLQYDKIHTRLLDAFWWMGVKEVSAQAFYETLVLRDLYRDCD